MNEGATKLTDAGDAQCHRTELAPIALFTFKRPQHTQKTLEGLATNPEFLKSPLFVFCDGARNADEADAVRESRRVVRDFPHPDKTVVEAPQNMGLARSVVSGVSRLCHEFGRVIVMEDDLVVSPVFLDYMNTSLKKYANEEQVYQVTGHMWPIDVPCDQDAFFMPITNSLGWGTWQRAWQRFDNDATLWPAISANRAMRDRFNIGGRFPFSKMMEKQLQRQIDSWAIKWYLTVFAQDGIVLYPKKSLLVNIGFDAQGTHSLSFDQERYGVAYSFERVILFPAAATHSKSTELVARYLARDGSLGRRLIRRFKKTVGMIG